ncbi:MAG: hypothetical protein QOH48_1477 [Actinomycetota bacterium]|jgi:hypothetical protein|nr:hypothetical protein [Actinomycetota bacterium]
MPNPGMRARRRCLPGSGSKPSQLPVPARFHPGPVGWNCLAGRGLSTVEEIRIVCESISKPLNVLARPNLSLSEIVTAGAQRISVGGALTWVAVTAMINEAEKMRGDGDFPLDVPASFKRWPGST